MTMNTLRTNVERRRRLFKDGAISSKYGRYIWQNLVRDVIISPNIYFVFQL